MPSELAPRYDSKTVETKWYSFWEDKGFFRPKSDREGKKFRDSRYVIVIPPPNVTGILHMGHALNNSIQDILTRWQRMKGRDTLWVPGVDHAGIATQNVVERKLAKEKKTRQDLGREKFLKEVWKWKEEHGSTITRQLRRLGASCDWSRERFTMDEGLSRAVREAFVTLYERGLIYRGSYIINWCPRCQTALSDEESSHKEIQGGLYHIKYPLADPHPNPLPEGEGSLPAGQAGVRGGEDHIVVATTRPETMLGDTAVAVHPEDLRYKHLIGKKLILPLMNREIPIIADSFVDPEFGTGLVKVTPAHDPNDFEMGRRHHLPQINVMNPNGTINEKGGQYKGLDRFEARKKVVADLEALGLFVRRDSHSHAVGHCYRCNTMVEPYLSEQWFVKMKPLAQKAREAHRQGKTKFYPDRWTKVYTNWLEEIRDWCISRQIWWGHQIPVWYCEGDKQCFPDCKKPIVSRQTPQQCPVCGSKNLRQDPDVLDTWFSSWLWPFSTLSWPATEPSATESSADKSAPARQLAGGGKPEETEDLKYFYPTSDLITAPEIIFFWVARMIMAGLEFMGEVPFNRIYIHGTVRAQSGLKMSKSLGNAIDPIEVIDEIGADALRFSMIMLSAQDVYLSREKFEVGRNFTNKIWNAARFAFINLEGFKQGKANFSPSPLSSPPSRGRGKGEGVDWQAFPLPCRWILSRLGRVTKEMDELISNFNLSQAATVLYHFVWNDFCDWFIELAKPSFLQTGTAARENTQRVLFYLLERILRLIHPFMPFISEEIWQKLKAAAQDRSSWPETLMVRSWPEDQKSFKDPKAEEAIQWLQTSVAGVRDIRVRLALPPGQPLKAVLVSPRAEIRTILSEYKKEIQNLARLEKADVRESFKKSPSYIVNTFPDLEVFILIEGIIDPVKEKERIEKKIAETKNWIESLAKKLSNEDFVRNAPEEIVQKEKEKLEDAEKIFKSQKELLELLSAS